MIILNEGFTTFGEYGIMGWLAKIFGAVSKEELNGLRLDTSNGFWVLDETNDLSQIFKSLHHIIDEDCILFFEGGSPNKELVKFIEKNQVREKEKIARGTIWPKQVVVHIPAKKIIIERLVSFADGASPLEFGVHFHIYKKGRVILEWHDAFTQEMLISKQVPENNIKAFANELSVKYSYEKAIEGTGGVTG